MLKYLSTIFATATICMFLLWACTNNKEEPNFVFILVDDLGWADVGCNNPGSFYETPNINKLSKSGVRFTQAYSSNPVCSPTRASIMTGKHPNNVNITDWIPGNDPKDMPLLGPQDGNELALEETTIAEALKMKGYKTCFIGKWHLGGEGYLPEDQGFDINIGGHHRGSPPGGYYSPYKNPKLTDGPKGEYLTDRLTDESIKFIAENKTSPFLLFLAYYTVHTPIQASKKHIAHYKEKERQFEERETPFQAEGDGFTRLRQDNADYASMVTAMDKNVGRLLEALEKEGLKENTWVIFTSDNGGLSTLYRKRAPTSNWPLRAGKGWCYEGGIRIPQIIAGPGVKNPGRAVDEPVVSMDFFPTIMEIAGIVETQTDGVSLLPLLEGKRGFKREGLFWHYPHYHGSAWKPGSALRFGDWKLVVHYENNKFELYNLKTDPGESEDLSMKNPGMLEKMKTRYEAFMEQTHARLPIKNPDYKQKEGL